MRYETHVRGFLSKNSSIFSQKLDGSEFVVCGWLTAVFLCLFLCVNPLKRLNGVEDCFKRS